MQFFNPFSVWSQVPITARTARGVRSIQKGTITIASGATTSNTATLGTTLTDVDRAHVIYNGYSADVNGGSAPPEGNVRLTLTNTTTVTANRNAGVNSSACTVAFTVIEYY
jgi:hypothetical protein